MEEGKKQNRNSKWMELKAYCLNLEVKIMLEKLKEIKKKWDDESENRVVRGVDCLA